MNFGLKDRRNNPLPPLGLPGDTSIPSMSGDSSDLPGLGPWPRPVGGDAPLSTQQPRASQAIATSTRLTWAPGGQLDGVSPGSSTSGVNSNSSQSAVSSASHYASSSHGSWPTPGNHSHSHSHAAPAYTFGSIPAHSATLAASNQYDQRSASYDSNASSMYSLSRPPHAAATGGDAISTPTYGSGHSQLSGLLGHGGGGAAAAATGSSATMPSPGHAAAHGGLFGSHASSSTQPSIASGASAIPVDPYSRAPSTPSYFSSSSTPQQGAFPSSTPHQPPFPSFHPSPTRSSPSTNAGSTRGLPSFSGQDSGMAPPQPYRPYSYHMHVPPLPGSVMSNLNNPGGQISVIPGMGGVHGYSHHLPPGMYAHPPNPQTERPYKCDQCPQSFNRNHDLKRHKRIHLAVKPFNCGYCEKAFSRKDALKVSQNMPGFGETPVSFSLFMLWQHAVLHPLAGESVVD